MNWNFKTVSLLLKQIIGTGNLTFLDGLFLLSKINNNFSFTDWKWFQNITLFVEI